VPTPSGYQTMKLDKGKAKENQKDPKITEMEHEWEKAYGLVEEFNDEDIEGAYNDLSAL
jgi:hypothetical protein